MKKAILYVMTNRAGKVKTFRIKSVQLHEDDATNLELFTPDKLRGAAQQRFQKLVYSGYCLSNWHVVETA